MNLDHVVTFLYRILDFCLRSWLCFQIILFLLIGSTRAYSLAILPNLSHWKLVDHSVIIAQLIPIHFLKADFHFTRQIRSQQIRCSNYQTFISSRRLPKLLLLVYWIQFQIVHHSFQTLEFTQLHEWREDSEDLACFLQVTALYYSEV